EVLDHDRPAAGGDAPGEPARQRHLHALADLLLEPAGGPCDEHAAVLVEEQDRRRVRAQPAADALEQLGEHLLEREVAEGRVGDAQHLLERARGLLAARGLVGFLRMRRRTLAAAGVAHLVVPLSVAITAQWLIPPTRAGNAPMHRRRWSRGC